MLIIPTFAAHHSLSLSSPAELCVQALCCRSSALRLSMQLLHEALQSHLRALQTQHFCADLLQQLPIMGALLHEQDHTLLQQVHQLLQERHTHLHLHTHQFTFCTFWGLCNPFLASCCSSYCSMLLNPYLFFSFFGELVYG